MQVIQKRPVFDKMSEQILVVKTENLEKFLKSKGIFVLDSGIVEIEQKQIYTFLQNNRSVLVRRQAEQDCEFKQIIPYVTLKRGEDVFLTRRSKKTTEGRLKNLYSFGVGGHLNEEDFSNSKSIFDLASRELSEEVSIDFGGTSAAMKKKFMGLIIDNSNAVGMVHLGLWMQLTLPAKTNVEIKSELAQGFFANSQDVAKIQTELEPWSRLLLPSLVKSS